MIHRAISKSDCRCYFVQIMFVDAQAKSLLFPPSNKILVLRLT